MTKLSPQLRYRIAVGSFFFLQGLVFASWASRIPDIKSSMGLSDAALGGILLSVPIGQFCAMALSGYLVSRFGSRKTLTLGALLYPGMLVVLGAVNSPWMLSCGLFFFGMAANLCNISVNTQGVDVERLYRRSIMATFHGLWSLAGFIGGVISVEMVAAHLTPLSHFCIICTFSIALMLIMRGALVPRDAPRSKKEEANKEKPFFVMPDRYVVLLGFIAFGSMACEGTMFDWSAVYFDQVIQPPKNLIRLGYIACMFTMASGRFIADRLITRFGPDRVVRVCGLLIAVGLLTAVVFPRIVPATLGFLLVGLGISATVPICYSLAGRSKTMRPGVALATVSSIGFLGFLLGPPVIGFIAQALSLRWSFALVACIGLTITILSPWLRLHKNPSVPTVR